ncbi:MULTISPECIES: porin [unclassified Agarivorans]|uniref:porin n=1 Tax=unclassified Agarivorans TaxID=2636026 RepID=UPI003D7E59E4
MKKLTLIALAVAAAAGSANAAKVYEDDTHAVDIYGRVYAGYISGSENSDIGQDGENDSYVRFGAKLKSAMTSNLNAIARYELQHDITDGDATDDKNGNIKTRLAYVGLGGDFGKVTYGRQKDALDPISGDITDVSFTNQYGYVNNGGKRLSNVLKYQGNFANINIAADYQLKNNDSQSDDIKADSSYGASLVYNSDFGLNVGAGYRAQNNSADGVKDGSLWIIGADYSIANAYMMAAYSEREAYRGKDDKFKATEAALGYKFTKALRAQVVYQNDKNDTKNKDAKDRVMLEGRYDLTKQARVVAAYALDQIDGADDEFTLAVRYDF